MELPPKISVLMSVRNGLPYVEQTVASILNQTYQNFEFVILDNASTDGSRDFLRSIAAKKPQIRLILNDRDLGHSGSLNRGLEACRGDWIARIDADDVALPNRLERQLSFVEANPDVAVTGCLAFYINEKGQRKGKTYSDLTTREKFHDYMQRNEAIGLTHPCVFMRRDAVLGVGGYREAFGAANDIDLWSRVSERGHLILVQPEYLMEYRIHPAAISSSRFLDARMKYEWARACTNARRSRQAEPSWESFLATWNSASLLTRLNRRRKAHAKMYYRLAGENFISNRKLKGARLFALSALLQPRYALARLAHQLLLKSPVPVAPKTIPLGTDSTKSLPKFARSPVTVIIPCYNAAPFIRQAIDSCLHQTRPPEQIIVVDDACTDGTPAILDEFAQAGKIRLVRNEKNLGKDVSLNNAVALVHSKYIAILDADDIALPARFERQVAFLEEHSKVGCTSSFVQYFNTRGEKIARGVLDLLTEGDFERYMKTGECIGLYCPAVMMRTEVLKISPLPFRKEFWPASDIDMWNRITEAGWQILAQPEFLTAYRIHGTSAVTSGGRNTRLQYDWVRACIRARRQGKPEPTREEFIETLNRAPLFARFNRWRKAEAKIAYRAAGFALGERQQLLTARFILRAFCLQPIYVGKRLAQQILE